MYHFLNKTIGERCKVFDSRTVTRYPVSPGSAADGIHYDQTEKGKPEQDKWAAAIAKEVKLLRVQRTMPVNGATGTAHPSHQ